MATIPPVMAPSLPSSHEQSLQTFPLSVLRCSTVPGNASVSSTPQPSSAQQPETLTILEQKKQNKQQNSKKQKAGAGPADQHQGAVRFDKVVFLGTGSAVPAPGKRNMSSLMITHSNASSLMVDCGEGTQHHLKVAQNVKSSKLDLILITHLHGDHCYGLFGLLLTAGQDGRTQPVTLVGPQGLRQLIMGVFELSGGWAGYYDLHFLEIPDELHPGAEGAAGANSRSTPCSQQKEVPGNNHAAEEVPAAVHDLLLLDEDVKMTDEMDHEDRRDRQAKQVRVEIGPLPTALLGLKVYATPLVHGMTCWGYCFEESARPGALDVKRAAELGVPAGKLLGQLKRGQDVFVEDESTSTRRTVRSSDVVTPPLPGRKICVLQDSSDSSMAVAACKNADLFIHEATLEDALRAEAVEKGHSTPTMAAAWANQAGAKNLVLTHFSARYTSSSSKSGGICCAPGGTTTASSGFLAGVVDGAGTGVPGTHEVGTPPVMRRIESSSGAGAVGAAGSSGGEEGIAVEVASSVSSLPLGRKGAAGNKRSRDQDSGAGAEFLFECFVDPADALGAEAKAVFRGEKVIVAKDFLMLEGPNFEPHPKRVAKRNPWARDE